MPISRVLPSSLNVQWQRLRNVRAFQRGPFRTIWRAGVWRIRCALGLGAVIRVPEWQAHFRLPPWWKSGGTTMFYIARQDYEPELGHLQTLVKPGDICIDGGANLGIFAVALASIAGPTGRLLAFEPQADVAAVLRQNLELNQYTWAQTFTAALSESEGEATLYSAAEGVVNASMARIGATKIEQKVKTVTLDSVVTEAGLSRVDFVKLDVEGAEELVLRGASQTLRKFRPKILFEVNPPATAALGLPVDGAWRMLEELGYTFHQFQDDGRLEPAALPTGVANVVALPERHSEASDR